MESSRLCLCIHLWMTEGGFVSASGVPSDQRAQLEQVLQVHQIFSIFTQVSCFFSVPSSCWAAEAAAKRKSPAWCLSWDTRGATLVRNRISERTTFRPQQISDMIHRACVTLLLPPGVLEVDKMDELGVIFSFHLHASFLSQAASFSLTPHQRMTLLRCSRGEEGEQKGNTASGS